MEDTPSGAGSVDLGADEEASIDNMVAAINHAGTIGTTYIDLTQDERAKLKQNLVTATKNRCTFIVSLLQDLYLLLKHDSWNSFLIWRTPKTCTPLGQKGCIDMVIQKMYNLKCKEVLQKDLSENMQQRTMCGLSRHLKNENEECLASVYPFRY